jgi:hypothetical protein
MTKKAITMIVILVTSVFLIFSVGCGGSSSDGSNPAGVSGSAS